MRDELLESLLNRADERLARPGPVADLAARVRRVERRRRALMRIGAAVIVLGGVAALFVAPHLARTSSVVSEARGESARQRIDRLRAEALQLASDAAVHERVADELLRKQRRSAAAARLERATLATDPMEELRQKRDRAADILVRGARRMEERPDGAGQAMDVYREAARLFGDTAAGREAARRLKPMGA